MNQPKQGKAKEAKQMIGIGRTKKRVDLSKEFDEFKQRIQEFQNKNEEIISRIRDAYTVKKKAIQQPEYAPNPVIYAPNITYSHNPQIYYQNNDAESVTSSCDYSKDVVFEGTVNKHQPIHPVRSIYNSREEAEQLRNQSAQQLPSRGHYQGNYEDYMRTQTTRQRTEEDRIGNSPDPTYSGRFGVADHTQGQEEMAHLEEQYRQAVMRSEQLEEALQEKQEELAKAKGGQSRLRANVGSFRRLLEDALDSYQEEVVGERFLEMQKYIRRCEMRLKNLSLRLKDSLQDRRSRRIIGRSRSKRNSISKPKNKESSLSQQAQSTPKVSRAQSQSKGRRSQNPNKHKQFEQIAVDYENMIKGKTNEVEGLERRINEELKAREAIANQLMKAKVSLDEKERELVELRKRKPKEKDDVDGRDKEIKDLKQQLSRIQQEKKSREGREKELSQTVAKLEKAKKALHEEYTENLNKTKSMKQKAVQQLQVRLREIETGASREAGEMRQRVAAAQKRVMEKECEMLAVLNKLKKAENESQIKEEKLRELQSLLLKDNDHADLLDRSVSIDSSMLSHTEVRHLQESLRKLDEELQERKAYIYDLQKEKYIFENNKRQMQAQNAAYVKANAMLEQKVNDLKRQLQNYQFDDNKEIQRELEEKAQQLEELQAEKQMIAEEKDELSTRNSELMQQLKKAKQNNLTANRELIKINSELTFTKNEQINLENKLAKAKEELGVLRAKIQQSQNARRERQEKLQDEIAQLRQQVENLKNHILQAQTLANRNPNDKQDDILLNSLHVSEISFNYHSKPNTEEQAAVLREKLREAQAALEIKAGMQEQIQTEYRNNLQRLRSDGSDKQKDLEEARSELQKCKAELQRLKSAHQDDESFQNYKIQVYQEKILQMEEEYAALKESEERLNDMLHQILQSIKQRDEEKEKLLRQAQEKDRILEELRQLLQLKEVRFDPSKTNKSDTLRDFSLRVSGDHSEDLVDPAELSYLSNISDVFKRDDMLQERIKKGRTGRQEQAKLFARTSAYIKSLKAIIQSKEKRVKLLEKQLTAFRTQEGRSWSQRERSYNDRPYRTEEPEDVDQCDEFKDYDSVQLDTRRSKYTELVKVLQHEKNLAVEENKLLSKQIQSLQDELIRSEEQENSLVRIKDLYKDQIKKLIEKNEAHTKQFETQIHKLKQQLQASESFHNLEAIKQLFLKIIPAAAFLDDPTAKPARRQEKRKELEEYVKVMSSILHLDVATRDRLLATLKK